MFQLASIARNLCLGRNALCLSDRSGLDIYLSGEVGTGRCEIYEGTVLMYGDAQTVGDFY